MYSTSTEIKQLRHLLARRLLDHRKIMRHIRTLKDMARNTGINAMIMTNMGPVTSAQVYAKTYERYLISQRGISPVRRKLARLEKRGAPPVRVYLESLVAAPASQPTLLLSYRSKEI